MIKSISIKNFKSIKEAAVDLPLMSAVVGRNAAGKTNFLQAINLVKRLVMGRSVGEAVRRITLAPTEIFNFDEQSEETQISICFLTNDEEEYSLSFSIYSLKDGKDEFELLIKNEKLEKKNGNIFKTIYNRKGMHLEDAGSKIIPLAFDENKLAISAYKDPEVDIVKEILKKIYIIDLNSDSLRESFVTPGFGHVASLLVDLKQKNGKDYESFQKVIKKLLPSFSSISEILAINEKPTSENEKLYLVLLLEKNVIKNIDQQVSMNLISDGDLKTLYLIALIFNSKADSSLIIEEIENGMHPKRIREMVQHLTNISTIRNIQLVFTTHSPVVINELKAADVIFVNKDSEKGSVISNIKDSDEITNIKGFLDAGGELSDYINSKLIT
jgi:AAA15 family ATPase/GTPase